MYGITVGGQGFRQFWEGSDVCVNCCGLNAPSRPLIALQFSMRCISGLIHDPSSPLSYALPPCAAIVPTGAQTCLHPYD